MIKNVLKVSAIVLIFGLASGCASSSGPASQNDIDRALAAADSAARDAAAAKSAARAARAAADAAQSTADRALSAATEAQNCCDANRDRLERMFKSSQRK